MPSSTTRSSSERDDKSPETDHLSKPNTQAKPRPKDGCGDRPSDRPPFPAVASATGINHGRPPKIHRFSGLVKPTQPAHTMIQIQPWQDYNNDAMRLDRINFGGVR